MTEHKPQYELPDWVDADKLHFVSLEQTIPSATCCITFIDNHCAPGQFTTTHDYLPGQRYPDSDYYTLKPIPEPEPPALNRSLTELAKRIYEANVAKGFWDDERNFGETIALMHSELSEALEEHRAGKADVYYMSGPTEVEKSEDGGWVIASTKAVAPARTNPRPEGVAVELVDTLIRILDHLGSTELNVDQIVEEKLTYNATRPYEHGKNF